MARAQRMVVQGARLRDQVYDIIRDELKSGELKPGERLYEIALAKKYGVSRTPVREALFQLAREGLLVSSERSFSLPVDTPRNILDRVEAHLLIDPAIASHAARDGTEEQMRSLVKHFAAEKAAGQAGKFKPFVDASHQFRKQLREMCRNVPLMRCAALIEDQFLFARNELFKLPEHREIVLRHDERVLRAVQARDADLAARMAREYMEELSQRFANWTAAEEAASVPEPAPRKVSKRAA